MPSLFIGTAEHSPWDAETLQVMRAQLATRPCTHPVPQKCSAPPGGGPPSAGRAPAAAGAAPVSGPAESAPCPTGPAGLPPAAAPPLPGGAASHAPALWHWTAPRPATAKGWVSSTSAGRGCLLRSCFVALDCASACSSQGVGQLYLGRQGLPLALLLCGIGLRLGLQQPRGGSALPRPAGVASCAPALWHWTAPRPAAAKEWVSSTSACRRCLSRARFEAWYCASACSSTGKGLHYSTP